MSLDISNTTGDGMAWSAEIVSGAEWLAFITEAGGVDAGTIVLSVAENTGAEQRVGTIRVSAPDAVNGPVDVTVTQEGLGVSEGEGVPAIHSADTDGDGKISLTELLRAIQFFNLGGYSCSPDPGATSDGYVPGPGTDYSCAPHAADYMEPFWSISLAELLRLIQFFNLGGYHACPDQGTQDGYCPGPPPVQ